MILSTLVVRSPLIECLSLLWTRFTHFLILRPHWPFIPYNSLLLNSVMFWFHLKTSKFTKTIKMYLVLSIKIPKTKSNPTKPNKSFLWTCDKISDRYDIHIMTSCTCVVSYILWSVDPFLDYVSCLRSPMSIYFYSTSSDSS